MIITGLRGVGKTVLLGEFRDKAEERSWVAVEAEITKMENFGQGMAQLARRALFSIAPRARWKAHAQRAAQIVKSFSITASPDGSFTAGLDVDPAEGVADSGNLSEDLTDLFLALGEAAKDQGAGVVFLFDEVQFLSRLELEALIAAIHKTVQRTVPVTLVGAGLPQIPRLAGEAKSYAERLFKFPEIGSLPIAEAVQALVEPASQRGLEYNDDAAEEVIHYTQGFPYFIQEYGKTLWDEVTGSPVDRALVLEVRPLVESKLDGSFFRVRAERTTDLELQYLRAMAELGPEPQKAADVAKLLKRNSEQAGPIRSRLIEKGLLYTPGYGLAAFTVPQFDRYMIRNHDLSVTPPKKRERVKRK